MQTLIKHSVDRHAAVAVPWYRATAHADTSSPTGSIWNYTQNKVQAVPSSAKQSNLSWTTAIHILFLLPLFTRTEQTHPKPETEDTSKYFGTCITHTYVFTCHTQPDKAKIYKEKWKNFPFPHQAGYPQEGEAPGWNDPLLWIPHTSPLCPLCVCI